jgi:hypothetical protein
MAIKLNQQVLKQTADLHAMSVHELDQLSYQQYGVSASGLKEILGTAHRLNMGGELSLEQARTFAKNVFGEVPEARIAELVHASNQSNAGPSRSRSFLQNLMKDRPDMSHRLGEVYGMAGVFGEQTIAREVNEHWDAKRQREDEQDKALGRYTPDKDNTEADPTKVGSVAHQFDVRRDLLGALDETLAQKPMSHNTRMSVLVDAKYPDENLGEIFRDRDSEMRGESNVQRSDLGSDLSDSYDNVVADAIDREEGTA